MKTRSLRNRSAEGLYRATPPALLVQARAARMWT